MRGYRWSSYGEYLKGPNQRPKWLRVDRLLGEMRIPKDSPAGRQQFERLLEERRWAEDPKEWQALRRGWYLGQEAFRAELLEQMGGRIGAHHGGTERRETALAKAERLLGEELQRRGWSQEELHQRQKADREKLAIAQRLRAETTMTWAWIASQLQLGTAGYAANSLRLRRAEKAK